MANKPTSAARSDVMLSGVQVAEILNCHKVTLWRWMREIPDFPRPVRISPGRVAFYEREIQRYIKTRPRA
jgi:predicted DNA-binding transcriptional regulator AlpA